VQFQFNDNNLKIIIMENLAGNKEADKNIKEELYLAGIPQVKIDNNHSEVPYTIIGKLGKWTFRRAWYYWVATVENRKDGLILAKAIELHERKHPTDDKMKILGNVIRAGGDCTCPSPKNYVAQPVYDEELDRQLTALGYKKKRFEILNMDGWNLNYGQISKLCKEGKLTVDRYVDCYHIDDQVGLLEFAKAIAVDCYKHCGNTQPSSNNTICLNCGSGIISEK
jgi:hypothetical protein